MSVEAYIKTRQPPTTGIFCAFPIWWRYNFKRWKHFFLEKKHFFFIIFPNLSNVPSFLIFCRKIQIFFSKTLSIFSEKPQILNVLRNLTISVAFYDKFATIWWKKNWHSDTSTTDVGSFSASSIGKHRVKNAPIWEEDFLSIFSIWRKIFKHNTGSFELW